MPRIIVKNLPENVQELQVRQLFEEIGPLTDCVLKFKSSGTFRGFAFVGYKTTSEAEQAVQQLNKTFFKTKRIQVELAAELKNKEKKHEKKLKKQQTKSTVHEELLEEVAKDPAFQEFASLQKASGNWGNDLPQPIQLPTEEGNAASSDTEETAAEDKEKDPDKEDTGRLFVRNLPYSCTEDDLKTIFEQYGPVSQVHLPVDSFTKKIKGFGFVTFLFPDHAEVALTSLDKTDFQGRLLHILKAEPSVQPVSTVGLSFKQKREAERKKNADREEHSWNSLFLGADAVADAIASQYGSSKAELLNTESEDSLAVRLALGETQLVQSTRKFLESNGVHLDKFKPGCPRSSQVFIIKNLPAGTAKTELEPLFPGASRVLLPPAGLAALIEYQHPAEARQAFKRRAYTKFKHLPLYLEWAPKDSLTTPDTKKKGKPAEENTGKICVRNIPFEAKSKEVAELFKVFGELRSVRLPKKLAGGHRGFGFVHFVSKLDAQRAFDALSASTHLYGRRLVLEWSADDDDNKDNPDS